MTARRLACLLVPLAGVLVAGGIVVSLALGGTKLSTRAGSATTSTTPAAVTVKIPPGALAFQDAIIAVVRTLSPSVVQIENPQGLGSGIALDANGDIVTNNHVVAGGGPYTVTTSSGKRYSGKIVGKFAADDLAVIRVRGAKLSPATFADSSRLKVGDLAIAIGNPLGLRSSVTDGLVSAFRQGISEGNGVALPTMIQTSAPINPGNSGGALADIAGRVIGIPTLGATDAQLGGSASGIGFAIPSNLAKDIALQIIRNGHVVNSYRAYLGIRGGDTNGKGVYVGSVKPGSAAAKVGIKLGDVIVAVHGQATPTLDALTSVLATLKPGQTVLVKVIRQNGSKATLHIALGTYPGTTA